MKYPDKYTRELAGLAATNMLSAQSQARVAEYFIARMVYRSQYESDPTMTALFDEVSSLAQKHPIQTIAFLERERLSEGILSSGNDGSTLDLTVIRIKSWVRAFPLKT